MTSNLPIPTLLTAHQFLVSTPGDRTKSLAFLPSSLHEKLQSILNQNPDMQPIEALGKLTVYSIGSLAKEDKDKIFRAFYRVCGVSKIGDPR